MVMAAMLGSMASLDAAVCHLASIQQTTLQIDRPVRVSERAGRSHGTTELRFERCKIATVERPLDVS